MYGLGAVIHLASIYPPDLELPFADPTAEVSESLATVFALTGRGPQRNASHSDPDHGNHQHSPTNSWEDWYELTEQLVLLGSSPRRRRRCRCAGPWS
jgi:hypothetical protein